MKSNLNYAILAFAVASAPVALAEDSDCYKVSEAVKKMVVAKPDNVLALVEREVAANPGCACEVVKAAIVASEAERKLVGQIVAAAIEAAPDKMRIISNCAIAVAPDALANIQAVLAKLEPQGGETYFSPKGGYAKNPKEPIVEPAGVRSPLDGTYLIPGEPPIHPPFITPPSTCRATEFEEIDIDMNYPNTNS